MKSSWREGFLKDLLIIWKWLELEIILLTQKLCLLDPILKKEIHTWLLNLWLLKLLVYTFILFFIDDNNLELVCHFRWLWAHKNVFLLLDIVFMMLSTSNSFYSCFSLPGFSLEYTLHIYGDSECEGRLLPGSAQCFCWQVSLGVLCAIINIALKTLDTETGLRNSWLFFFFLIASIFLLMTPVKLSIK